jgi:predicted dehydrogenase
MLERLLVVGLGSIGRRHVRLARSLVPDSQIAVLRHRSCYDVDHPGIDLCFTSLAAALEFRPQAAVIATPASHHLEVALVLARAGVHLLVEKPVADTTVGVSELIEICRARGITLMIGYNLRFLPTLVRLRELVEEGRVGRPLSVRVEVGQFLPSWRPGTDYRQTVSANAALGGGVLLELSHEIDYLRWLFGEVQRVSAVQHKLSGLEIDVEDTAHLVLEFADEREASPLIAAVNMDLIRHDVTRSCTVIGETGSLRWDAVAGTIEVFEQGADAWRSLLVHPNQKDESYLAEWRHFLKCVADGGTPLISGYDGLAVLRIIEAARLSSKTGSIAPIVHGHDGAHEGRGTTCKS